MRNPWLAVLTLSALGAAQEIPEVPRPRVLFLTHSAGFEHPVVKRAQRARLAHAERELTSAAAGRLRVECTQDCSVITAENLAKYGAVAFYTTGELPLTEGGRQALLDFVRRGGGFVGVHSATDTFYRWPEYGELIGGYFDGHPWHQKVALRVEDRTHPATAHLGERWEIADEIYQFRSFRRDRVRVLLSLDPDSVQIGRGKRDDGDYAIAWCRDYARGRVFYTALGHRPEVWKDATFRRHLVDGICWATSYEGPLGAPPSGATVLFGGTSLERWEGPRGRAPGWKVAGGAVEVIPGSGSIQTKDRFQSFQLHVEFRIPEDPEGHGNSGVYLQRRYEVQILDSSKKKELANNDCGALYRQRAPDRNAFGGPGEWQSYDITFTAARFDASGKKTRNARIRVLHNGIVIHDDVELTNKTGAGQKEGPEPGPILLQDHGSRVRFRNVWIVRR